MEDRTSKPNQVGENEMAAPNVSRRGFMAAAGTAGLGLTALAMVAREASAATLNKDLTMAPNAAPQRAYPEWFPSCHRLSPL